MLVEFIKTCPCCDAHARAVQEEAAKYPGAFDVKIYTAGKDVDYLKKYGMITKGTLVIDGKKRIDALSRDIIANALRDAAQ